MSSLVLVQLKDIGQVRVGESLHLMFQAHASFAQILASCMQFLGEPLSSLRPLKRCDNVLRMREHLTHILPYQLIELLRRNVTRGALLVAAGVDRTLLAAACVVRVS